MALFNEGAQGHFFSPKGGTHNEAPKRKMLLCWSSRMQILEQFDGTIEWKVTERSEGAPPATKQSEEHPQQRSKVRSTTSDEAKRGAPPVMKQSEEHYQQQSEARSTTSDEAK